MLINHAEIEYVIGHHAIMLIAKNPRRTHIVEGPFTNLNFIKII